MESQTTQSRLVLCVQEQLRRYFEALGEEPPQDIYSMVVDEVEWAVLSFAVDYTGGNLSQAAQMLGISRTTLRKKLKSASESRPPPVTPS